MLKTKIVCTIGPASRSEKVMTEMLKAGMNVARLNFSHGDHESHREVIETFRRVRERLGKPAAIMLDTKGPEVRIGTFKDGKITLKTGDTFILTTEDVEGDSTRVSVTYADLPSQLKAGDRVLIDDGRLELTVREVSETDVTCIVVTGGTLTNRKGVNIPGVHLDIPYLSERDMADLRFGVEMDVDYIAASFVRTADDIIAMRNYLDYYGGHDIRILAKIENAEGIENFESILEAANGIMVARGDMGVEIPFEEVPHIQKDMIKKANKAKKHVITATQMLESMITNPRPTRAEVTDVANAVYEGTTAIMLSGETAAGKYPVEAVAAMSRIAIEAEKNMDYASFLASRELDTTDDLSSAIAFAACTTAIEIKAAAIISVTISGSTCKKVAGLKPPVPILGGSMHDDVCRKMSLMWGVQSMHVDKKETEDELFEEAIRVSKQAGYIKSSDRVVIVAGVPLGKVGSTNMIRVVYVE